MIEVDDFRRAIQWLRGGIAQLEREPNDPVAQLGLLHSFEVTFNVAEALLREVYAEMSGDEYAEFLSTREVIWRAGEDGLVLSSRMQWARYGFELESMREACMFSSGGKIQEGSELLSQFAGELEYFADSLQKKLASNV